MIVLFKPSEATESTTEENLTSIILISQQTLLKKMETIVVMRMTVTKTKEGNLTTGSHGKNQLLLLQLLTLMSKLVRLTFIICCCTKINGQSRGVGGKKGKILHTSQVAHSQYTLQLVSITGSNFATPLDGLLVHHRFPPSSISPGFPDSLLIPIYTPGWREAL